MTTEERLAEWMAQAPTCRVTAAEWQFLDAVRAAATQNVGYGWMQQVIEWEWQNWATANGFPGSALGPEYFDRCIQELEAELARAKGDRS